MQKLHRRMRILPPRKMRGYLVTLEALANGARATGRLDRGIGLRKQLAAPVQEVVQGFWRVETVMTGRRLRLRQPLGMGGVAAINNAKEKI
jgi:hypothetical protein